MFDQQQNNPKNHWRKRRFFFFPLIGLAALLLFGGLVMLLWNAVLPAVAPVKALSYWQGVGLLLLSRILFGGFRGGPWRGRPEHRGGPAFQEKWRNMSAEERVSFKEAWKERCRKRNN